LKDEMENGRKEKMTEEKNLAQKDEKTEDLDDFIFRGEHIKLCSEK